MHDLNTFGINLMCSNKRRFREFFRKKHKLTFPFVTYSLTQYNFTFKKEHEKDPLSRSLLLEKNVNEQPNFIAQIKLSTLLGSIQCLV